MQLDLFHSEVTTRPGRITGRPISQDVQWLQTVFKTWGAPGADMRWKFTDYCCELDNVPCIYELMVLGYVENILVAYGDGFVQEFLPHEVFPIVE